MGATTTTVNKQCSEYADSNNSMYMKLIQLWLTSFAIGIPSLRLLFFFDFRHFEIIIAAFFTMLIFGTMYILDENDRLWRIDDAVEPCNEVIVPDGERLNSVNSSSNHQNKSFEIVTDAGVELLPSTTETI